MVKKSNKTRRDIIRLSAGAGVLGLSGCELTPILMWPTIKQLEMAEDVQAAGSVEVDLSVMQEGQQIKMLWRGKPVFVRYRKQIEIDEANDVNIDILPDPETDNQRLVPGINGELKPQYLVLIGICTHFGCVPIAEQGNDAPSGEYGGWYCPCHAAHFDTSGRIRKGPAPRNLEIPPYEYLSDTVIKVG